MPDMLERKGERREREREKELKVVESSRKSNESRLIAKKK
jgi:hypothetical protein